MILTKIESLSHTRKVKVRSEKNNQTNIHMYLSSFISHDWKQKYKESPILDLKKKNVSLEIFLSRATVLRGSWDFRPYFPLFSSSKYGLLFMPNTLSISTLLNV